MTRVYALWAWFIMITGLSVHVGFVWLTRWLVSPAKRESYSAYTAHVFLRVMTRLCGIRVRLKTTQALEKPVLIIANHTSHFDILSLMIAFREPILFVAKVSLFKLPILGQEMRLKGDLCIHRDNRRQSLKVLNSIPACLAAGRSVVIFPEGTRSPTGDLGNFYPAIFSIAYQQAMPLLPVILRGTRRIIPKSGWRIARGTASVEALPIVDPRHYETATALRTDVWNQMHQALNQGLNQDLNQGINTR